MISNSIIHVLLSFVSNAEDEEREQLAKEISKDWSSGTFPSLNFLFFDFVKFVLKRSDNYSF